MRIQRGECKSTQLSIGDWLVFTNNCQPNNCWSLNTIITVGAINCTQCPDSLPNTKQLSSTRIGQCTECPMNRYKNTLDNECTECTTCALGYFPKNPCTDTADTQCFMCYQSQCSADEFASDCPGSYCTACTASLNTSI
jgi:hypothetical protein